MKLVLGPFVPSRPPSPSPPSPQRFLVKPRCRLPTPFCSFSSVPHKSLHSDLLNLMSALQLAQLSRVRQQHTVYHDTIALIGQTLIPPTVCPQPPHPSTLPYHRFSYGDGTSHLFASSAQSSASSYSWPSDSTSSSFVVLGISVPNTAANESIGNLSEGLVVIVLKAVLALRLSFI